MKEAKVSNFLIGLLKTIKPEFEIKNETLISDLDLEDIDFTEIAVECEDEFEIILDELHIEKLKTVEEIINYIETEIKYKE